MGLLSNRSKPKPEKVISNVPTAVPQQTDKEQAEAAAKLQAIARGKKARFAEEEKQEAAKKIQKLKRGHSARNNKSQETSQGGNTTPVKPAFNRRVSFGAMDVVGIAPGGGAVPTPVAEQLIEAINRCIAGLPFAVPCWQDPRSATSDADSTVDAAIPTDKLASAAVEKRISEDPSPKKALLTETMRSKVKALFEKLDLDGDGSITFEEAKKYWGKNFAKVNAKAMFNEVDDDGNGSVTFEEWVSFWENVVSQPDYEEVSSSPRASPRALAPLLPPRCRIALQSPARVALNSCLMHTRRAVRPNGTEPAPRDAARPPPLTGVRMPLAPSRGSRTT